MESLEDGALLKKYVTGGGFEVLQSGPFSCPPSPEYRFSENNHLPVPATMPLLPVSMPSPKAAINPFSFSFS